jgi:hypothetical protein
MTAICGRSRRTGELCSWNMKNVHTCRSKSVFSSCRIVFLKAWCRPKYTSPAERVLLYFSWMFDEVSLWFGWTYKYFLLSVKMFWGNLETAGNVFLWNIKAHPRQRIAKSFPLRINLFLHKPKYIYGVSRLDFLLFSSESLDRRRSDRVGTQVRNKCSSIFFVVAHLATGALRRLANFRDSVSRI